MSLGAFCIFDSCDYTSGSNCDLAASKRSSNVCYEYLSADISTTDLIRPAPGTGDASMTLAQLLPQARFVLGHTPQPVAQKVARRAAEMATQGRLEIGRRHREHGRLRQRRAASASRSSARAAVRSWPTSSTCRCWARCRSRCRCARPPTPARRCR